MKYALRLTENARHDLKRLHAFLLEHDENTAKRAIAAIETSFKLLETFPFSCRKASADNPFLRELVITFGSAGYVALFDVGEDATVTILAVRHQREEDYH
jgi:plasmid stabilization system protein ParE